MNAEMQRVLPLVRYDQVRKGVSIMIAEFRKFIMRGNVLDLAVGIIIGAAFTSVVNSLVNDVLMPPIGLILGQVDFSNLFISLSGETFPSLRAAQDAGAATLNYGLFITSLINFLIVAFVVFLIIRAFNRLMEMSSKKQEAEPPKPPEPTAEEKLLAEIRDLLKETRA
jgi:large conductance mechanosensitive channel